MKRVLLTIAIAACGSSEPRPAPPPPAMLPQPELSHAPAASSAAPDTTNAEDSRTSRMLKRVASTRGLAAKKPVPGVMLERDDLLARVKAHVNREVPHQAIVDEGLIYQLLGEIPAQFDYEKAMFSMLEAQLAGYYEPADGTMYMAKDLADIMADMTLSHELVHALQDQHFDLKSKSKYMPGQGDAQTAISALAEGDATSSMIDVALEGKKAAYEIPDDMFAKLVRQGLSGDATGNAPRVMSASLVAPYVDGTLFVNELRRRGGWGKVDEAWNDIPKSTEQILHVDKWVAREAPIVVNAPTAAALGAGWTAASTDTLGELTWRTVLEEWIPKQAAAVAAHWGGDRSVLFHNGESSAFAWRIRYDAGAPDDAFAASAFATITPALGKLAVKEAAFACLTRADRGALAVTRKGRDLVIVAGPAKTPAQGAWTPSGDCVLARKWSTEILSK